jgi:diketogulonate reductase-like aldo/keto reductase
MRTLQDTYRLSNGVRIPCLGFGTWRTPDGEVAVESVKAALAAGYRHIDTAAYYGNEASIGRAIRESGLPREEIFVTSKVWNTERGYDRAKAAFQATLDRLGLDYLDLYLIHWPAAPHQHENWEDLNRETWRAMTELYQAGKIRAIGVSNFLPHHLKALMETEVTPMVDQIEFHPGQRQAETVDYCAAHGILVEAWSPMARGKLAEHPLLVELGEKYHRSVPQICLRWCLQHGVLPLPKSVTPSRIRENTQVFDFALSQEDMAALDGLPLVGSSGHHPDRIEF